jgi:uncharacterized CHY-type Zn-finger protein
MKNLQDNGEKKDSGKAYKVGKQAKICFACGEKLSPEDQERERCPYCGVKFDKEEIDFKSL